MKVEDITQANAYMSIVNHIEWYIQYQTNGDYSNIQIIMEGVIKYCEPEKSEFYDTQFNAIKENLLSILKKRQSDLLAKIEAL